jgi:protein-S-isoprenylcysteine O-methyltransferase Ste14
VNTSGTAGVIARPIRLFPADLLLGFGLDHLLPLSLVVTRIALLPGLDQPVSLLLAIPRTDVAHSISVIIAGALILVGIALFTAAVRNFSRAATPLPTNQPARVLVTTGIHGRTRNPIYLGFFLIYVGIGIAVHSPWILTLTLPIAAAIRYGVVAREEAYLERRFGDAYRDYKAPVPRWV